MSDRNTQYKVFIKVPFARGDFTDPPDPKWSSSKDKELWRVLSSTSKGKDVDWHGLADKFEVTLPFLLQQAAWLYDRQLSQVREQLRRVNKPGVSSAGASPTPPLDSASTSAVGSHPMRRVGSAASGARVSSNLGVRPRTSLDGNREGSVTASPIHERPQRVPYSRQTSATTITQVHAQVQVPRPAFNSDAVQEGGRQSPRATNESVIRRQIPQSAPTAISPKASPSPSGSSSSSEDDAARGMGQSRAFARRPQFSRVISKGRNKAGRLSSVASEDPEDDDSDSDEEFLPFASAAPRQKAAAAPAPNRKHRPVQPLHVRSDTETQRARPQFSDPKTPRADMQGSGTALSSSPSATSSSLPDSASASQPSINPADRSHRSPLNALSPKQRRSIAKDGSDTGTPSMGSSFSDLDDASVNTSAMEEALATQMRAGGMGAASALRSSLAMGGRFGGLWRGGQGGQGQSG